MVGLSSKSVRLWPQSAAACGFLQGRHFNHVTYKAATLGPACGHAVYDRASGGGDWNQQDVCKLTV